MEEVLKRGLSSLDVQRSRTATVMTESWNRRQLLRLDMVQFANSLRQETEATNRLKLILTSKAKFFRFKTPKAGHLRSVSSSCCWEADFSAFEVDVFL